MKKLILIFAAFTAFSFVSCNHATKEVAAASADSTVVDSASIDTLSADSVIADSVCQD